MFLNTFSRFSFETHLHALALIKKTLPHTVNTRRMCTESWVCLGRRDTCRSVCRQEVKTISRTKWWKEENKTKSSLINRVSDAWVKTQSQFFFTPHPSFPYARCLSEHSYLLHQMVTHSGASLHRWRYFPLRSPLSSSALWSHTQHLVPPRTVYLSLSHKKKKKRTRGPEPPRGHFLYLQYFSASVFFFFTGMVKIRTGNSRRGQILCNLQEAAAQRTERSHERQKTELSIIRTPREWSARISERGARYVNEGNFHKLGLAQTEAATEIHKETVREIRGRV